MNKQHSHDSNAESPKEVMPNATFKDLNLNENVMKSLDEMGFTHPTPIQLEAIPLLLQGVDLVGQAKTGTGKTAAFGIPILESINLEEKAPQALILVPTRELAIQVSEELSKLGKYIGANIVPVYGGQDIERQFGPLKHGAHIVVGTPGRVMDHLNRKSLDLHKVKTVVLDEADRMLDMGFIDDVGVILGYCPVKRQTLLFSATMPKPIMELSRNYMINPEYVKVSEDKLTVDKIEQFYYVLDLKQKIDGLCTYFKHRGPTLSIIFTRTKKGADKLGYILKDRGFKALALHGDLSQNRRDRVMDAFRNGQIDILVATDLAARGLDVDDVSHVVNFNLPGDAATYVHRIGRTGRAGKSGEAVTFVTNLEETREIQRIGQVTNTEIKQLELPVEQFPRTERAQIEGFDDSDSGQRRGGFGGGRRFGGNRGFRGGGRSGGFRGGGNRGSGGYRGNREGGSNSGYRGGGQRSGGYRGGGNRGSGGYGGNRPSRRF